MISIAVLFSKLDVYRYLFAPCDGFDVPTELTGREVTVFCNALKDIVTDNWDIRDDYKYVMFDGFDSEDPVDLTLWDQGFAGIDDLIIALDQQGLDGMDRELEERYTAAYRGDGTIASALREAKARALRFAHPQTVET